MSFSSQLTAHLQSLFDQYADNEAIEVISLATTDGFPVLTLAKVPRNIEEDSLSAAASTLHSVSNAVAHQILGKSFKVTFIEAQQGNVAIVNIELGEQDCVLVMSANETLNIASLRLLITRLAKEIQSYSLDSAVVSA